MFNAKAAFNSTDYGLTMQTYLDSFTPTRSIRQAQSRGEAALMTGITTMDPTSRWWQQNVLRAREMVRHYVGWNYVSVNRICSKVSMQKPMVGRVVGARKGSQNLSKPQRQHLRNLYGGVLQSHQDIEPAPDSNPLVQLLKSVNPVDWWGSFAYELQLFWQLTGKFFIWTIPNGIRDYSGTQGLPSEMWIIPSHWCMPEYDRKTGQQTGWTVVPDGDWTRSMPLPLEEVIYGWFKSPLSKTDGYSPTQAGARWIDNSEMIETSRSCSFRNGANPDVLVELDGDKYNNPDDKIIERIKDKFKARMAGPLKAGDPIVAPPGVKLTKWSNTPREMDYSSSADQTRDNVLALRGVPKVLAGITDDVNRASIEGANVIFCETTINPLLAMQAGFLTRRLASRFDPSLVIWFDDCIPLDAEQEMAETELDAKLGAISPDERRVDRGRMPWGTPAATSGYLPAGLIPLDEAAREELSPQDVSDDMASPDEPPDEENPADAGDAED